MTLGIGRLRGGEGENAAEEVEESEEVPVCGCWVLRLIQGRCCLNVGLTLSFYSFSPLMRKHLKGSEKCDFDKKPS